MTRTALDYRQLMEDCLDDLSERIDADRISADDLRGFVRDWFCQVNESVPFIAVGNDELADVDVDEAALATWVQTHQVTGSPDAIRSLYKALHARGVA